MSSGESSSSEVSQKAKHEWYQSDTQIVLQILSKNVGEDSVKISFTNSEVSITFLTNDGYKYDRVFFLAHEINPSRSSFKVLSTKIEIRLMKDKTIQWSALETAEPKKKVATKDWDKVVSGLEDDQPEGDAALNALFQKIYAEGSDEVKKAMNKSFLESGGTELNTNWDHVKKDRVSIKPPAGMEWKAWDT